MDIEEIHGLWDEDSKIDPADLGTSSLIIPQLHAKYMRIYTAEKLTLKRMEQTHKELFRLKWEYYGGTLDSETLAENGWKPNPLKILRSDIGMHIEADQDIIKSNLKVAYIKEKVDLLESIVKTLNNRGFLIKNYIDWYKFTNGA